MMKQQIHHQKARLLCFFQDPLWRSRRSTGGASVSATSEPNPNSLLLLLDNESQIPSRGYNPCPEADKLVEGHWQHLSTCMDK